MGVLGALIEFALLKRLYAAPELLQLTATFGIVLVVRDATLAIWGAEDRLGPRVPWLDGTLDIAGRAIPEYDLFLIVVGPLVLLALTWLVTRTRFGMLVRAASENRELAGALGVRQAALYTAVFALGAFLAGLAGALQLPREPANLNMDLAVVAEAFVVTVVGGLGSIPGAFVAALLIGLTKALCIALGTVEVAGIAIAFPRMTLVVEFVVMAVVLAVKPHGLLGRPAAAPPTTPLPEQRTLVRLPGPRAALVAAALLALLLSMPLWSDAYTLVLATDVLIAALFAASLQFILGPGGMTSFGHAAWFGIGAYAAALAFKHGWPMPAALALAPAAAMAAAVLLGAFAVRLAGVYLAMLTLAFAQIVWSIVFQWDAVTGGSNGLVGIWPPEILAERSHYYLFTLVVVAAALFALVQVACLAVRLRAARHARFAAARRGDRHRRPRDAVACVCAGRRLCRARRRPLRVLEGQHLAGDACDPALGRRAGDGAPRRSERAVRPADRRGRVHLDAGRARPRHGLLARGGRRADPAARPAVPARHRRRVRSPAARSGAEHEPEGPPRGRIRPEAR